MTLQIFIGTEPKQYIAQRVLEASIRRWSSVDVAIYVLPGVATGLGQQTGFSFNRWGVLERIKTGRAVYLDADIVVRADVRELFELAMPTPILARRCDPTRYYTSVMLFDADRLKDAGIPTFDQLVQQVKEQKLGYLSAMWAMAASPYAPYMSELPTRWNDMDIIKPTTAAIHYTGLDRQPWRYSGHRHGAAFHEALGYALREGSISKHELNREIEAGHVRADLLTNP